MLWHLYPCKKYNFGTAYIFQYSIQIWLCAYTNMKSLSYICETSRNKTVFSLDIVWLICFWVLCCRRRCRYFFFLSFISLWLFLLFLLLCVHAYVGTCVCSCVSSYFFYMEYIVFEKVHQLHGMCVHTRTAHTQMDWIGMSYPSEFPLDTVRGYRFDTRFRLFSSILIW